MGMSFWLRRSSGCRPGSTQRPVVLVLEAKKENNLFMGKI